MAIRFQCASCHQPIEVDDEWASRLVACPFCSNTITAPAHSTIGETYIPAARPPSVMPPVVSAAGRTVSVVAAVLAGALVLCLIIMTSITAAHRAELEEFQAASLKAADFAEQMRLSQEFVMKDGRMPGWIIGLYGCALAGGAFWVAAVVCGIIGALRPARRQLAIAALVVCAGTPVFCCCGGIFT